MDALDWSAVARGALWIGGLGCSLAALSHVRWAAQRRGVSLRTALGWDAFLVPFWSGLVLFSIGLAWGAEAGWQRWAWIGLALLFAWQALLSARAEQRANVEPDAKEN
jgi:hypothetical protein